ncbi:ABC transporter permease [Planotetraspora mira]|uniref:Peptide ABC transporter permease n=1 Tax=Planotetraspora mira TaxID=58121 RepID=A0A8J3X8X8_9ACTN|nr:ABC transporter permease [Planotetraspora mira]GII31776.1 peptide ABC transporter permease [Planotetraspora mira]
MTLTEAEMPPRPGLPAAPAQEGRAAASPIRAALKVFVQNRLAVLGLVLVVLIVLFCFVGPLVYHTDQVHTNLDQVTLPPGAGHPVGTDSVGYDELGRLMAGGQTSLEVGLAAALIATLFGSVYGAIAGYVGGVVDGLMMRVTDILLSIPTLFFLLLMATIFRPSKPVLIIVIAVVSWLIPARLIRGETLTLKIREYVQAARGMGAGGPYNLFQHVLPNAIGTIAVNVTFQIADAILAVAAMSYLGLGVPPPAADWGGMLSDGVNYSYSGYWWLIYPPGLAIVLTVVAFNFIGDAVRDSFESRLRTVRG